MHWKEKLNLAVEEASVGSYMIGDKRQP